MHCYTVRSGDTLWSIAEKAYGDGQLWSFLADHNPLARCGALFAGQELLVPPPPAGPLRSLADPSRPAVQLGHLPVQVSVDASVPYCLGWSVIGTCGLRANLTFYRRGAVDLLGDLNANRLMVYRFMQLEWAFKHLAQLLRDGTLSTTRWHERNGQQRALYRNDDCVIAGTFSTWAKRPENASFDDEGFHEWKLKMAQKALATARLSLDEPDSLGPTLRSACPHLISSAELWAISRDRRYLPASSLPTLSPAAGSATESPALAANGKPKKSKTAAHKLAQRKPTVKKPARAVKARKRVKAK